MKSRWTVVRSEERVGTAQGVSLVHGQVGGQGGPEVEGAGAGQRVSPLIQRLRLEETIPD